MSMPNRPYLLQCPNCEYELLKYLKESINVNLEMLDRRSFEQVLHDEYTHRCPNCDKEFHEHEAKIVRK